nr:DUF4382 domain-containing protein [Gemmatimonadales bacterium]
MRSMTNMPPALFAALAVAACGSTEPQGGLTSVLLTDSPFPYHEVARVDIYVVRIQASEQADTGLFAGDTLQTGLRTIVEPRERYNLLELQGGATAYLGDGELPASVYRGVRLTIDTDSSSFTLEDGRVLTGESNPGIYWQFAGEIGLNAFVHEPVEVADTGAVVVIDFDVGRSFIPLGVDTTAGRAFLFIPYIRAVNSAGTGAVGGTAVGPAGEPIADATVSVLQGNPGLPENTWSLMSSGKTDAQGDFLIPYLWPRSYILAVDAYQGSGYGSARVFDVVVTT